MRVLAPSLAILVALAIPAVAQDCVPTTSTTGVFMQVLGPDPVFGLYFAHDVCQLDAERPCFFSTWFYLESNGVAGLQRHDEQHDDTCGGEFESDTVVS